MESRIGTERKTSIPHNSVLNSVTQVCQSALSTPPNPTPTGSHCPVVQVGTCSVTSSRCPISALSVMYSSKTSQPRNYHISRAVDGKFRLLSPLIWAPLQFYFQNLPQSGWYQTQWSTHFLFLYSQSYKVRPFPSPPCRAENCDSEMTGGLP